MPNDVHCDCGGPDERPPSDKLDARGWPVKRGDIIVIPCRVEYVGSHELDVNLRAVTLVRPPGGECAEIVLNTQQVMRANAGDDLSFSVALHEGNAIVGFGPHGLAFTPPHRGC